MGNRVNNEIPAIPTIVILKRIFSKLESTPSIKPIKHIEANRLKTIASGNLMILRLIILQNSDILIFIRIVNYNLSKK